ncbi:acetyl-CoA synthetase-like protein [Polychaeton citri CBS 116435]|uniref:Acetyl-CoA synthetase-like protein n=1 Tax=Polychaeton citri CBS 116435 TaxID=1314669 RepID=A0A9P4UNW2_9PEZI|nr:acetyl-CoA synthetase-like protein [Polychaeton citri CBS 116435]
MADDDGDSSPPEELSVDSILKLLDTETKALMIADRYQKQFERMQDTTDRASPGRNVSPDQYLADDRTFHVPRHIGHNILPNHAIFSRLLRFAHAIPQKPCIRDDNIFVNGKPLEANHVQLLSDVIHLRARLWRVLTPSVRAAVETRSEVYIAILAPGSYEFTVAILAVLALGAIVVPISVALPAEEAVYFVTQSRSVAVLCAEDTLKTGTQLERLMRNSNSNSTFTCLGIKPSTLTGGMRPGDMAISSDRYLDENGPSVVIFTSGTTGPPKGSVKRRAFIFDTALGVADHYQFSRNDTVLHLLPVHHATGIGVMVFPSLVAGALIEFKSTGGFSSEWTWKRWREGGVTVFSGVPTIYMRMKRYYEDCISLLPANERDSYIEGARQLRCCLCGTSALPKPIADFWTVMLGKPILLRYGATEIGAVFKVRMNDAQVPEGSVGTKFSGHDVKLRPLDEDALTRIPSTTADSGPGQFIDDADEGEICVKSPEMFLRYAFDPIATAKAHTIDGYYRTGDIACKEFVNGEAYYKILGRASVDIIKSGGYKISALDVEREMLGLPYVAEVMVVGVPDEEFGERVAAVVILKTDFLQDLSIERLRHDLRSGLAGYKLPTLIRIAEDELPKSGTGKVVKRTLGPHYFPEDYRSLQEVQVWNPEGKHLKLKL